MADRPDIAIWLAAFGDACACADAAAALALLAPDCHWRDLLVLRPTISTASGRDATGAMLAERLGPAALGDIRLAPGRTAPRWVRRAGEDVLEALIAFDSAAGPGDGVLRLRRDEAAPGGLLAWVIVTALQSLHGTSRPALPDYSREFGGENWADKRRRAARFADRDPAVLVVGAGQAGLSVAARLGAVGVDTLVIDRQERVGDNWRKRYHALVLHNETRVNHLPFMPFPPTWPDFIPKDRLANWFEAYAEAMELNVWCRTELAGGAYDGDEGRWTLRLSTAEGERTLRPFHVIFATGVSSIPVLPDLPGLSDFRGAVMHSGAYREGSAWRGRRAIVLGTGNSGHDVAQDLHGAGAAVTLVQRSPTYVVSLAEAQSVYSIYTEGLPTDDCDLLATATPYDVLVKAYQLSTAASREVDRALHESLASRGFELDFGEDDTGFQMKYLRRGGGYYFNVGCSELIASGAVGLLHWRDANRFVAGGLRMKDGAIVPADLLVLATGYKNQQETVRACLGDAVADRIGPVWGFGADGELRNMWRPTAQPGLWFTAGSLAQCRIYSKFLALQIQAALRESAQQPGVAHPRGEQGAEGREIAHA